MCLRSLKKYASEHGGKYLGISVNKLVKRPYLILATNVTPLTTPAGVKTIEGPNGTWHNLSVALPDVTLVFFQVYRAKLVPCDQCQRQLLCPLVTGSDSNIHSILGSSSASTLSDSLTTQLNFVWLCRFVTIDSCISHAFVFCVSSSLSDSYGLRLSVTSVSECDTGGFRLRGTAILGTLAKSSETLFGMEMTVAQLLKAKVHPHDGNYAQITCNSGLDHCRFCPRPWWPLQGLHAEEE